MRLIIGSLVIFSLVILFLFALFPSEVDVSRVVPINGTREKIQRDIADLRRWGSWNELYREGLKYGEPGNIPLIADSNKIRKGSFEINVVRNVPDTVVTAWRRGERFFEGVYTLSGTGNQVVVYWALHFRVRWYPWEKLASMFYDKQLGPAMEQSLLNLKGQVEGSH